MATINPHTTRATGTVLTAAIYNADHQNHITNATNINSELAAVSDINDNTGIIVSSGTGVISGRSLAAGNNIVISNANGVVADPTISLGGITTVDNTIARYNGVAGAIQSSGVVIDDTNNISGVVNITSTGLLSLTNAAAGIITAKQDDSGSALGPILDLFRNSTSPAALDSIGQITFSGNDSAANKTTFAAIDGTIITTTDGSEAGKLNFRIMKAGALVSMVEIDPDFNGIVITSLDPDATAMPGLTLYRNSASPLANDELGIVNFDGKTTTGAARSYATLRTIIDDPTNASEDSRVRIHNRIAGALTQQLDIAAGLVVGAPTGGAKGTGTVNATGLFVNDIKTGWTQGTKVNTTSGTAIDITGIPAGVKQIVVAVRGVSSSGSSALILQIGDSGGVETTGYSSAAADMTDGAVAAVNRTNGFSLEDGGDAADVRHGRLVLTLEDPVANVWSYSSLIGLSNNDIMNIGAGSKALSATLDRLRLTTDGGTETFDAGEINIVYET